MDDLALLTIGKLYLELTNFQRIIEAQNKKIQELESLITTNTTSKEVEKSKDQASRK